ncbi:hypothetical protein ANRL1_04693 [Anaerolineae bacterium]|nr:hypothetical protein ANRL1_04693 [Anaerolineae bacterium]
MSEQTLVSKAFQIFMADTPQHAQAWGAMPQALVNASALESLLGAR